MKRLLKNIRATSECDEDKTNLSLVDLVDVLNQIEELKNYNIAIRNEDGAIQLAVGDSRYELSRIIEKRHPRRRLHKMDA